MSNTTNCTPTANVKNTSGMYSSLNGEFSRETAMTIINPQFVELKRFVLTKIRFPNEMI